MARKSIQLSMKGLKNIVQETIRHYINENYEEDEENLRKTCEELVIDPDRLKFDTNGVAIFIHNGKYNFITYDGRVLLDNGVEWAELNDEGYAIVKENGKYIIFDTDKGKFLKGQFEEVRSDMGYGYIGVKSNGKWNFINIRSNGKIVSKEWFDDIDPFSEGCASVKKNGKWGFIDEYGYEVAPCIFNDCLPFVKDYTTVFIGGATLFLTKNGKLFFYKDDIED